MVKNLSDRPAPEKGEKGDPGRPGNDASLPTGAVVAFAKNSCPSGWDEYSPAYGRFVRGIDRTGRIDPDGQRPVGSSQEDSFKNHDHRVSVSRADTGTVGRGMLPYFEQRNHPEVRSSAEGGRETRPKNIALLYCIKQ